MAKKVVVIGAGLSGLSAASFMAREGWEVTVLEKQAGPGGRVRQLKERGFVFDMGPSWYWMPDVFERYFGEFGKKPSDYYALRRLDPSYRVYEPGKQIDIPAGLEELKNLFESIEPGAARRLDQFLEEAGYKYRVGMQKLVFKPGLSLAEFLDADLAKGLFRLDVFTSVKKHIRSYFRHPSIQRILEFPVLFLGALAENTPALYSLMNYADIIGGTWYPHGGMYSVVSAMHALATELGVRFYFSENVNRIEVMNGHASRVHTENGAWEADAVIGAADYHFIESRLLAPAHRSYTEAWWEKRVMAPSCLIYYIGLNKKLSHIAHHSLFFDTSFEKHAEEIYTHPQWPSAPLFYMSAPSVSDATVAPPGCENLFFLVPVSAGLGGDTEAVREKYFNIIMDRMEANTGQSVRDSIVFRSTFAHSDFVSEYNSYKGNAYGLANTLSQTAILKPSCRSKKIQNLFYAGQLTVPGPGMPPALISGEVASKELLKAYP